MIGDNIFKIPVISQYCEQYNTKACVVVDEYSSRLLVPFLEKLPYVEKVFSSPGINNHTMGGQPYDFGRDSEWKAEYDQVYHLGFRRFPFGNLTVESAIQAEVPVDINSLRSNNAIPGDFQKIENLVIHISSGQSHRNEAALRTILPVYKELRELFKTTKILVTNKNEQLLPSLLKEGVEEFDDGGDLWKTVELFRSSVLVAVDSCMWALMAVMRGPCTVTPVVNRSPGEYDGVTVGEGGGVYLLQTVKRFIQVS